MQIKNKLKRYFQSNFLQQLELLSLEEQKNIVEELNTFSWEKLLKRAQEKHFDFKPIKLQEKAPKLTSTPNFGVLVLAGGDGSRLNSQKPKALFELLGKTLLEWHLDKIDLKTPTFLLCSTKNIDQIEDFLTQKKLLRKNLKLLCQNDMPLLDLNRQFFLIDNNLAKGPCGNADALIQMRPFSTQFEHLVVLPIDNPLANPQDLDLLSHHIFHHNEVTIKAIQSEGETDMGLIVQNNEYLEIIEYSNPYFEEASQLSFFYNTGIYCIQTKFLQRIREVPFNLIKKQNTYKPEGFIFDHFTKARQIGIHLDQKKHCFCPLKSQKDLNPILALLSNT